MTRREITDVNRAAVEAPAAAPEQEAHVTGVVKSLAFYRGYGFTPAGAVDHGEPVLTLPL